VGLFQRGARWHYGTRRFQPLCDDASQLDLPLARTDRRRRGGRALHPTVGRIAFSSILRSPPLIKTTPVPPPILDYGPPDHRPPRFTWRAFGAALGGVLLPVIISLFSSTSQIGWCFYWPSLAITGFVAGYLIATSIQAALRKSPD